jgi:carboxylesterase
MKPDDFCYMRRGKPIAAFKEEEAGLLGAVDLRRPEQGRALLLLHGYSSSPAVYRFLIPQLNRYHALFCPVLPGHGLSIEDFSKAKAKDWVRASRASFEVLAKEYEQVDVLGLSLGGLLACLLSQDYPVHHLYLLAPAFKVTMNVPWMIVLAKALSHLGFKHLRNKAGDLQTHEQAEIALRKLPLSTVLEMLEFLNTLQWVAPQCPVDLFLGRHDQVVASNEVEQLFAPLPNARIHWLEHSAHVLPLDNDLDLIVSCLNESP